MNAIATQVTPTETPKQTASRTGPETIREMCESIPAEEILERIADGEDPKATESYLVRRWVDAGYPEEAAKSVAPPMLEGYHEKLAGAEGMLVKAHILAARANRKIVESQLLDGEECLAYQRAETRAPFLVRILPFLGDLLAGKREFLIAVTDVRLLILELEKPRNVLKDARFKSLVASVPHPAVASIEPTPGGLTSRITIRTSAGKTYTFSNMLRSAAEKIANDFRAASHSRSELAAEVPHVTNRPPKSPAGRVFLSAIGALALLVSVGGFAEGDIPFAFPALLVAFGCLWFGCVRKLVRK